MRSSSTPTALAVAIPVDRIVVKQRLRKVELATVSNLKVAITEGGFNSTILVRPIDSEDGVPLYELVYGAHRLTAAQELGHSTIPALVRELTDDEAAAIEIDENLVRRGLTPLERAETLEARFSVWRRRFPERVNQEANTATLKRGRPRNSDKMSQFFEGAPPAMGFAEETAAELGLGRRSVERSWGVVTGLPVALRNRLHGTWIAKNEGALRQLAGIGDRAEQAKVADVLLGGQTKNISDARAIAAGNTPLKAAQTPVDETLKAFRKLWGAASPSARGAILHDLAGRSLPKGFSLLELADD